MRQTARQHRLRSAAAGRTAVLRMARSNAATIPNPDRADAEFDADEGVPAIIYELENGVARQRKRRMVLDDGVEAAAGAREMTRIE